MRRVADLKPGDVVTAEPPWTFRAVASVDGPWTWVFTDTGPRRIPSGAILWLDGAPDDHRRPLQRRTPPARPPKPRQLLKLSRHVYNQCVRLAGSSGSSRPDSTHMIRRTNVAAPSSPVKNTGIPSRDVAPPQIQHPSGSLPRSTFASSRSHHGPYTFGAYGNPSRRIAGCT